MTFTEQQELLDVYDDRIGGYVGPDTDGDRPEGMPTKDDADYVVSTYSELQDALGDDNAVVTHDTDIDLTHRDPIWCADNITLFGQYCDPDVPGLGYKLHYDKQPINGYTGCLRKESGASPTFYGVYMDGPLDGFTDADHTDPDFEDRLRSGVWVSTERSDGLVEFIGCRFTGWTWAGVVTGDHGRLTETDIKRSALAGNNFNHYGYGVSQRDGDLWVDLCFFDNNRHHTAGYGHPSEYTDITRSVAGPGPGASHAWDKHEDEYTDPDDEYRTSGGHLRMRNVTTMQTKSIFGGPQEAVKNRGVTYQLSWIGNSHFYHTDPPSRENPNQVQVIRQETNEWLNFDVFDGDEWGGNNYYGPGKPPKGIGAPLDQDPDPDMPPLDQRFEEMETEIKEWVRDRLDNLQITSAEETN